MSLQINLSKLWTPKKTQDKFLNAIATSSEMGLVAYVGSLGSGKTWALCRAAIGLCHAYPGIKILLGRHHGTDLRDTTMAEFFKMVATIEAELGDQWKTRYPTDPQPTIGTWEQTKLTYTFHNNASVLFRPLDEAEVKYKSLEIAAFGIDEASEVKETATLMLIARCRQMGFPHVGFIVSNPTSYGHWLYKWFVGKPNPKNVIFRTNTLENVDNLPIGYVERLREQYPPDWVRRYLEGEWGGLDSERPVIPNFDPLLNVKPCPFYKHRVVHVGIDPGFQTPGVAWTQVDPQSRLTIVRSWRPRELTADRLAEGLLLRNAEWFPKGEFRYYTGVDANTRKDTGDKTAREIFRTYGIDAHAKYRHVDRGLTIIRNLAEVRDDGMPGLLVDPYNQTFIEGFMGGYYYEPEKDKPHKDGIHDPLFDALRYIVIHLFDPSGEIPSAGRIYPFRRKRTR